MWTIDLKNQIVVAKENTGYRMGEMVAGIEVKGGSSPNSIAAGKDKVFVTNATNDNFSVLDPISGKVISTIQLKIDPAIDSFRGMIPFGIELSHDGSRLYAALSGLNCVVAVDAVNNKILGYITTGWFPTKLKISPDDRTLYVVTARGYGHYSPKFGEILKKGISKHPDAAFFSIVGDLVSDGLNRNQWDDLFRYVEGTASQIPFMSVPGNHDNRAGLGAKLFCDLFSYPLNGPNGVPKEQTYSFVYKNALFLMIDVTSPIDSQTVWIENQLASSKAKWKIAMFHFPPYNWEEPYLDIQKAWVPLFDKYHVDMVFGGHLYQYVIIEGNYLYFESVNADGILIDSFHLRK